MSPAAVPHDLSRMVESLSTISDHLVASYAALSARAEHVETELVAANQALEEKVAELDAVRGHLEAILSALPSGVVVRDREGRIVRVNPAVGAILGTQGAELIGERTHPQLRGAKADGQSRELVRADGRRAVVAARWSPVLGARGESLGSVEILDDRTELARLTERLHDLDKMAALGNMAGGIAHEIRNPMNAIGGFAELLRREFEPSTRAHRFAARICEGIAEIDAIIANVLSFANPERLCLETVDAKELVLDAIRSAKQSLPEDAPQDRWKITHDAHAPKFQGDRIKVRQALRNLIANALQAQPDGGRVDVRVAIESGDVVLRVEDAGPGVSAELRGRIREPFFTTRPSGTGLGLALVHTIAELHGGRFEVSDQPSTFGGALMVFRFPFNPGNPAH